MIKAFAVKVLSRARALLGRTPPPPRATTTTTEHRQPAELRQQDPRLTRLLDQGLTWGTREQTELMGAEATTVAWGHNWVIRQLSRQSLFDKVLVDLGSGVNNPLIAFYGQRVRHAYLIDLKNPGEPFERASVLTSNLEEPLPLPDASANLVVSTSVLEHLTEVGRRLQMREIERVLRPGGKAFVTMSYFFGLDEHAFEVLGREPGLIDHGNAIVSLVDAAVMLDAAPGLRLLGHAEPSMFPGFDGFDERRVREIPGLLTMTITDSEWATFTPETNALGVEWAEMGIAIEKPCVGDMT